MVKVKTKPEEDRYEIAAKKHAESFPKVEPVTLSSKDDTWFRNKFDKHARALTFVAYTTYYIKIGYQILKHCDTEMLFYLFVRTYRERKRKNLTLKIW